MPHGIKLIARTTVSSGPTHCALCGESFELLRAVATLSVDDTPRGYVCQGCLIDSPGRAAVKIRARAEQLYDCARKLLAAFPDGAGAALILNTRERADSGKTLGERVGKLTAWEVVQAENP